jgi:hypothetical protein
MTWTKRAGVTIAAVAALVVATSAQQAQVKSQRINVTIDAPVMVPGATLQPGQYTFELMDSSSLRHTVRIVGDDGATPLELAYAVPMRRNETDGDIVLKFNSVSGKAPVAIKGWFYPGTRYGHEFIYSDAEARRIAEQTKTLVLSSDSLNNDDDGAMLYTYDGDGTRRERSVDQSMAREWRQWHNGASGMQDAMTVTIGTLEDNPSNYVGKRVTVTAEVEDVLGPRLFTIDEPNWADLGGELVVYVPSSLTAVVSEDDQVTVTGEVRKLDATELQPELDWFDRNPDVDANRDYYIFASRVK